MLQLLFFLLAQWSLCVDAPSVCAVKICNQDVKQLYSLMQSSAGAFVHFIVLHTGTVGEMAGEVFSL